MCSGQTCRLPTGCGVLRLAGAKATCRGVLPACGIWRRAAASYDGQGQKPPAGACFLPAASGDALRRPTMGRSKSDAPGVISGLRHLPTRCGGLRWAGVKATRRGGLPACGSVYRPAAPLCDGQEQKPPAGVCSGQTCRLPTGCASLRWAGAKTACRGALRSAAPSADRLRLSAMGRSKSHLPGCALACCGIWRPAAAAYDGQGQKRPAGVCSGLRHRLPTGCGGLRWAGAKATCRGDLPLFCKIRRVGEVYPRH